MSVWYLCGCSHETTTLHIPIFTTLHTTRDVTSFLTSHRHKPLHTATHCHTPPHTATLLPRPQALLTPTSFTLLTRKLYSNPSTNPRTVNRVTCPGSDPICRHFDVTPEPPTQLSCCSSWNPLIISLIGSSHLRKIWSRDVDSTRRLVGGWGSAGGGGGGRRVKCC